MPSLSVGIYVLPDSVVHDLELGEIGKRIDEAVYPALQSSPHLNVIAAAAVALKEAQSSEFQAYQSQVLKNAFVIAERLEQLGYSIITGEINRLCLKNIAVPQF